MKKNTNNETKSKRVLKALWDGFTTYGLVGPTGSHTCIQFNSTIRTQKKKKKNVALFKQC